MFAATLIVAFELDHDTRCGAAVGNVFFDRWIEIAARVVCTPADPGEGASYRKKKREHERPHVTIFPFRFIHAPGAADDSPSECRTISRPAVTSTVVSPALANCVRAWQEAWITR
jgi:hypothetical protein